MTAILPRWTKIRANRASGTEMAGHVADAAPSLIARERGGVGGA